MMLNNNTVRDVGELFAMLDSAGSLDDCLDELSAMAAQILGAQYCHIALLAEEEQTAPSIAGRTGYGWLPGSSASLRCAWPDSPPASSRTKGSSSEHPNGSMFSTIVLKEKTVGLIQAAAPVHDTVFCQDDLDLLNILTALITKSIQVIQLQQILRSQFTQLALINANDTNIRNLLSGAIHSPNQIARILARSFYREMLNAGFNFNQILFAATEVISELSASVRKHSARRRITSEEDSKVIDDLMSVAPSTRGNPRVTSISG